MNIPRINRNPLFMPRAIGSFRAGVGAAKIAWANPAEKEFNEVDLYTRRVRHYDFLWNAFQNTIFLDLYKWENYLSRRGLYKRTLCVYNPIRRLVDFYASQVYPGLLSEDGSSMITEYGVIKSTAIPLAGDTPDNLRLAIAQTWQWSNWQENMSLWITYCASVGDGPVEIIDNWKTGKVMANVIWPGDITDVMFDAIGNVVTYTKQIPYLDEETREPYTMQKVVTKKLIQTFRNEMPYGYNGLPAEYANPYGFCPLVWNKHRSFGADVLPGSPAVRDWTKIEELNSLVAQVNAYLRKQAVSPQLLAGVGQVVPLPLTIDGKEVDPDDLLLLLGEKVGAVQNLQGNLNIEAARGQIRDQLAEVEADHPEIVMYHMLRQMSQVSGAALDRLMGDVLGMISLATRGYDQRSIQLFQMMVAIGGMRYQEGRTSLKSGWAANTKAQQKFKDFNLDSYHKGDLNFAILERSLTPPTEIEQANAELMRYSAVTAGINAGYPRDYQMHQANSTDEDIEVLHRYEENSATWEAHLQTIVTPPPPPEPVEPPKPIVVPEGSTVHMPPTPAAPPSAPPVIPEPRVPPQVFSRHPDEYADLTNVPSISPAPAELPASAPASPVPPGPATRTDKGPTIVTAAQRNQSKNFAKKVNN